MSARADLKTGQMSASNAVRELMMLKCHSRKSIPAGIRSPFVPEFCGAIWGATNQSESGRRKSTAAICDRESFSGSTERPPACTASQARAPAKTQSRLRLAGKDGRSATTAAHQSHKNVCV
ncbi:hypothetical protein niasHS_001038 [Heterodera schachtii]|uniref:Uncharacterized protein n=1 Tax=Heterodera schachtii TaxID=97005 RepID=A0ABD2K813_HETSC